MKLGIREVFLAAFLIISLILPSTFAEDTLTLNSPTYFDEENNIYDVIHYIDNEMLSFTFCADEAVTNVNASLTCSTTNTKTYLELHTFTTQENCYFSNYELNDLSCDDFTLTVDYNKQNQERKIERVFEEEKESKLINHILSNNPSSLDPVDLSYYLTVLTNIESTTSEQAQESYELLRDLRSNSNKCWPKEGCTMNETTEILSNLKIAGYEASTRLLEDGELYIETRLIDNDNAPKEFSFEFGGTYFDNSSNEADCNLTIDGEDPEEYTLGGNDDSITDFAGESIALGCNVTVSELEFYIYDLEGDVELFEEYINRTELDYTIDDYACVGENNNCDYDSSINGLIAFGSRLFANSQIVTYIRNNYIEVDGAEVYLDTGNRFYDGGKFLYYQSNESLLDYLKFEQNNDGSWGDGDDKNKVDQTAWAILGVQAREPDSENVDDGKKWIYYSEPLTGWGSVKKNALAYLAIKEQIKPYLVVTPVNSVTETIEVTVENPTIFTLKDIKVDLGKTIAEYVGYTASLGTLESEEKITFNVSQVGALKETLTGTFKITGVDSNNNRIDLVSFPINVEGKTQRFKLQGSEKYTNEEGDTLITFTTTEHNNANFECSYVNPFNSSVITRNINTAESSIVLNNSELIEGEYTLTLSCTTVDGDEFEVAAAFSTEVLIKTFKTDVPEIVMDTYRDVSLTVESISEEDQELKVEVTDTYGGILVPLEEEFTLRAGAKKKLRFLMGDTSFLELLSDEQIIGDILITGEAYEKAVPINREQKIFDFEDESSSSGGGGIWGYIIMFFIVILLALGGLVGYRFYELRKTQEEETKQEEEQKQNQEEEYIDL